MYPYISSEGDCLTTRKYGKYELTLMVVDLVHYEKTVSIWLGMIESKTDLPEPPEFYKDIRTYYCSVQRKYWEFWFEDEEDLTVMFKILEDVVDEFLSSES